MKAFLILTIICLIVVLIETILIIRFWNTLDEGSLLYYFDHATSRYVPYRITILNDEKYIYSTNNITAVKYHFYTFLYDTWFNNVLTEEEYDRLN